MASTNHTTNYELSQFTQTDKPAWLGDYNQDMSKIDAQMKTNADAISTNASNIATNTSNISANATAISGLQANDLVQDGKIAQNTTAISDLEGKFNLSNVSTYNYANAGVGLTNTTLSGTLTLAQNTDGSVFKLYGSITGDNQTGTTETLTKTSIAGMPNAYGIKTTLQLNTSPTEAFTIQPSGISVSAWYTSGTLSDVRELFSSNFVVGTDGFIYLTSGGSSSQTKTFYNNRKAQELYFPSIYFNTNWGDQPE